MISLHQRFDVEAVMRDIEVKRATYFPGVPTMWIAIAALPDLDKRDFSSLTCHGPTDLMISNFVASYTNEELNWGMASALGVILLIATLLLYFVFNKLVGVDRIKMG